MADGEAEDQTCVRVAVRCRPISKKEIDEGGDSCVEIGKDGQTVNLVGEASHTFAFDHVFGQQSQQADVFKTLGSPLLDKAFEGYNATIFAYGQTGSGKTHTMMGDRNNKAERGLIPRIADDLFQRVADLTTDTRKFLICCSFLEIYNEIVYDLLVPRGKSTPKTGLEIREQKGIGVYVKDLQEIVVESSDKLQKLIDQGFEHRATAATQMNATSSRSHCLFIVKMHQKDDNNAANNNFSKMNLVDLAGSERASRTGAQGDTLKEGANINKSLSSLGNVINALSKMAAGGKKAFIPYRDSKLTRVLQESLGGNALTTMMAALSPAKTNYDETLGTLNYAKRAKTIKVNATKNEESEQIARLEEEVENLKAKLQAQAGAAASADTAKYEAQIEEMERFMKQTWDDKEQASRHHEEQRKALEAEAEKIRLKALEEKNKRIQLLEAKGDLELSIQDLRLQADSGSAWTACSDPWPKAVQHLLALEQRVSSQCRAAGLLKDSVLQDLAAWVEQRQSQGRDADEGSASSRLVLSQAERKTLSVMKELEKLERQEREVEQAIALLVPEVQRTLRGVDIELTLTKEDDKEEQKDAGKAEEVEKVLSLIRRQLDDHKVTAWSKIAEDHRNLGNVDTEGVRGLLTFCAEKGQDVEELKLELEIGGSSGSRPPASPRGEQGLLGAEASAALCRPLGLASGALPDTALAASSNKDAAHAGRLLNGVPLSAFGGWCPAKDEANEYLQIDLQEPMWICGLAVQGRRPACGSWQRTRPLVGKVIEPDPLPPERIFKRPPVRLVHDVIVAARSRHQALCGQEGLPDFSKEQLDYRHLQKADRQFKLDVFDLVIAKINAALKASGIGEEVCPPVQLSASEILGGKNTAECNRMLQLLCYLALRQRDPKGECGGLLDVGDQWVTKYSVSWSADGAAWAPIAQSRVGKSHAPTVFAGAEDAETARYVSLGSSMPPKAVRYLQVHPQEWHRHAGLRVEVYGWPEGVDVSALGRHKAKSDKTKRGQPASPKHGAGAGAGAAMLAERPCRLEIVRRRLESVKRMVEVAGGIAVEAWKESQKADDRKQQQAMAEKTAVEQQLADALRQIEELKSMQRECLEKAAETEQKLIDTETEKLQVEVDRDRAEEANRALQEKVEEAKQACLEEKGNVDEFQKREEASKAEKEELMQQVGVLTEECEAHKQEAEDLVEQLATKEEELMNTNMGYCNLSDQMGDMREEFDEKARQLECVNETLSQRNAELLDEGIALRKEVHEWRHKVTDAEKAITRAQQGMPLAYSFLFVTPLAPETPNGAKAAEQAPREEKKRKKKSKYDEDFDEDLE